MEQRFKFLAKSNNLDDVDLPPKARTETKMEAASAVSVADASKRSCSRT